MSSSARTQPSRVLPSPHLPPRALSAVRHFLAADFVAHQTLSVSNTLCRTWTASSHSHFSTSSLRCGVSPDHLIALGCSAGGWTSTTLAIPAEDEWKTEMAGHDLTLSSTNLQVSSAVQTAVVMSGGPEAYNKKASDPIAETELVAHQFHMSKRQ